MSQAELAIKVNKSKQTISKYVNDAQVMSLESAVNIAKILKCEIEDLYEVKKE